ncbi:conserved protein of unknown function [Methylocella tundrae]|uniref:Uncharacterized protein n=1 Tax=Methylocella tundrae TaxID=227605 RepID=A0A4U8Z4K0_METTU|nr:conserved protein of unknown function [Methylocella tundrae]
MVREGESDQVRRKLGKLFEDPIAGPPLKADLTAGMTALPTWMWAFLKPLIERDADDHRRYIRDDRDADAADANDHDRHQRGRQGDDDQHHTAGVRPRRKPVSTQTTQTAKRGATRAAKT